MLPLVSLIVMCFGLFVFSMKHAGQKACLRLLGAIQSEWMLDVSLRLAQKAQREIISAWPAQFGHSLMWLWIQLLPYYYLFSFFFFLKLNFPWSSEEKCEKIKQIQMKCALLRIHKGQIQSNEKIIDKNNL